MTYPQLNNFGVFRIYKFLFWEFKNKVPFLNYMLDLLKKASENEILTFYKFLQSLNEPLVRPIRIKYLRKKNPEYILSNELIIYYVYFKHRKETRGKIPKDLRKILLGIKERALFKKSFRKNGYVPKSTLFYWYSNDFGKFLLIYLQKFIAGICLNFVKNLPYKFIFLDSTRTVIGENGEKGVRYCLISLYLNNKHKEIFSINKEFPSYNLILFIILDYDLDIVSEYFKMLKGLDIKTVFADGEFCNNKLLRVLITNFKDVQVKPHRRRFGRFVSKAEKMFSPEVYKARFPGESVFGNITNNLNEKKLSKEKTYPNNYVYGLFFYQIYSIKKAYDISLKYKKIRKKTGFYIVVVSFGHSPIGKKLMESVQVKDH